MVKSFVSTVVGGAIGLIALYVVGRVAYQAGHDVAMAEQRYNRLLKESETKEIPTHEEHDEQNEPHASENDDVTHVELVPVKRQSRLAKLGAMLGIGKLAAKKDSVLGRLIRNPEAHRIEAYVDGDEVRVNIKPQTA